MNKEVNNPLSDEPEATEAGGPYIPPTARKGSGVPLPGPPPNEEFTIEVELAPGVEDIDALMSGVKASQPTVGGTQESNFVRVARTHGLIEARPVFTREEVERDRERVAALRNQVGTPGSVFKQLKDLDQLPPLSRFVRLRFPPGTSASQVVKDLNAIPEIKHAVVVPRAAPPAMPTDPMIGNNGSSVAVNPVTDFEPQWYLHRTRAKQAWRVALGAGVVIAAVDWGCLPSHPEYATALELTYNAVDGSNDVTNGTNRPHGTAVLGLAGARADGRGMAGYAPDAALWAIQGNFGAGPPLPVEDPWVEAIEFARRTDAGTRRKVILVEVNTIYGGNYEQLPTIRRAINFAIADGCVVCTAAGNGNRPADLADDGYLFEPTGSIVVGATSFHATDNERAWFSNYGPTVVVSAPGDLFHDVTCSETADIYRNEFGGTSGAVAKVAGAVALMLSANPNLSHRDVRVILETTGSPLDTDEPIGVFLNTNAAVREARRRFLEA